MNPLALLAASGAGTYGAPVDTYFPLVTALLHGDGTNGAANNSFIDSSVNNLTITRTATTGQGTFSPFGINWSNYFDGSTGYLTGPSPSTANAAFQFSGNFTVEAWIYPTSRNGANMMLLDTRATTGSAAGFAFGLTATNGYPFVYTNSAYPITAASAAPLNAWTHLALVRSGSTLTLYVNGVSAGTASNSSNFSDGYGYIAVATGAGSGEYPGYISNFRINNTTAVYTTTFTPPTTILSAITGTSLLTCQANRFMDASASALALTVAGSVKVLPFSPFHPAAYSTATYQGSALFDGVAGRLNGPTGTATQFSGNFTVEFWLYATSLSNTSYPTIFATSASSSGTTGLQLYYNSGSAYLGCEYNNGTDIVPTGTQKALTLNAWYHIALVRNGTSLVIYINGVAAGPGTTSQNFSDGALIVGANQTPANWFQGYIADLRVNNTTAVYTSNFTPPTTPLTTISGTSVLLNCANGGVIDNAMQTDLITVGGATVSTSTVKYGTGSIAFDGSTGYAYANPSPQFQFAGDFTVEFWINFTSLGSGNRYIFDARANSSSTTTGFALLLESGVLDVCNGTGNIITSSYTPTTGVWTHVALCRTGSSMTLYANGTSIGTASSSVNFSDGYFNLSKLTGSTSSSYFITGFIDEFRITNGYCRYTTTFTPAGPFPNQ